MLNLSVATIRNHLKVLINLGFIDERNNPKYKWDRTKQYRVNLVNIAKALYDKGFSFEDYKFELPFLNFKNGILEFENQSEKNQNAIPNITTEITTKITNKNKTPLPPIGEEVVNLVEHWNCKGIIRHDIKLWLNDKRNARIKKAINQYGLSQIQTAIDHYATVIQDTKYTLFKYKWDLDQFLKQENALPHFLENGSKWLNYCNWRRQNNKSVTDNLKSYYEKLRAEEENEEISENTLF